jgi:hypothetical protein
MQRQESTHAGTFAFSRRRHGDRRYFAAVEAEIAQGMVIQLAECFVHSPRLTTLPVTR